MENIKFEILKFISENPKNLTIEVLCDNFKELSENEIFDYLVEFRADYLLTGFHLFEFDQGGGKANLYKPRLTEKGKIKLATYIQENSKLTKVKKFISSSKIIIVTIFAIFMYFLDAIYKAIQILDSNNVIKNFIDKFK